MANTRLQNSDYVRFVLQNGSYPSKQMDQEPDGWENDNLEIVRHKQYHGMFTQFTGSLEFYGVDRDYIKNAFELGGLNTDLYLIKYVLGKTLKLGSETEYEVKWELEYIGLADFETLEDSNGSVKLNFNSNSLETLIKAHESDVFEIERLDSIDSKPISKLTERDRQVYIQGRTLVSQGESQAVTLNEDTPYFTRWATIPTKIIAQGDPRHSTIDNLVFDLNDQFAFPQHMFFVDETAAVNNVIFNLAYDIRFSTKTVYDYSNVKVFLNEYSFNGNGYDLVNSNELVNAVDNGVEYTVQGVLNKEIDHKTGFLFYFLVEGGSGFYRRASVNLTKYEIKINIEKFEDPSTHRFLFIDDVMSRLMEILTGKGKMFYSKMFGRKQTRSTYRHSYIQDGIYGLVGMISGYWIRKFDATSDKYKSMQISIKDAIESLQAMFNIGVTIETVDLQQRLRIEDLKYFYQNEVAIKLPHKVSNVSRKVDKTLYFSGTTFGQDKGGDYENDLGLDEPNTKTSTITPLRKTEGKYSKITKIRSDETGLELLRIKPQVTFSQEDVAGDDDNWFLDLKRSEGPNFLQNDWSDRLTTLPGGVLDPKSYRSMLFTPLRMLLRHGWIIRAGMEQSINMLKKVKYINAGANKLLKTWFIGEPAALAENGDLEVRQLERPRFLPEIIKFKHPVDEALMKQIKGFKEIEYEGDIEKVPNLYFKVEFINEDDRIETGYILGIKPGVEGEFELQKANENLIF